MFRNITLRFIFKTSFKKTFPFFFFLNCYCCCLYTATFSLFLIILSKKNTSVSLLLSVMSLVQIRSKQKQQLSPCSMLQCPVGLWSCCELCFCPRPASITEKHLYVLPASPNTHHLKEKEKVASLQQWFYFIIVVSSFDQAMHFMGS